MNVPTTPTPPTPGAMVLARGEHWAVFAKPAGMTVVGGRGVPRPTLLDIAIDVLGAARPVHRLDKPTTGCCIVASTLFGQQILSDAFRRRIVDKRYLAIVEGKPTWSSLVVDARLARIDEPDIPRVGGKKAPLAIQTIDEAGDKALTRLRVLAVGDGVALVEARPETGRMHQIRCHLAHVGHPIVGDKLYGATTSFVAEQELALHAFAVSFPRPEGGRAAVTAPLPPGWWTWGAQHHLAVGAIAEAIKAFLPKTPTTTAQTTPTTAAQTKTPARTTARNAPAKTAAPPGRTTPKGTMRPSTKGSAKGRAPAKGSKEPTRPTGQKPGQPQSRRGEEGARSGPSRRGGRPGR
jgi:RluA family pseudouridine synthase